MDERRALLLAPGKKAVTDALAHFPAVEFVGLPADACRLTEETVTAVDRIMATTPFSAVVATSESNVALAGFLRSRYGLAGAGFEDALVATNKWRMKRALAGAVPLADFWLSGEFLDRVDQGLPVPDKVVVKPLSGSLSRGVRLLSSDEAVALLRADRVLRLVETAVEVQAEMHCDGVIGHGRLLASVASLYERPCLQRRGAGTVSIHLPASDARSPAAEKVAREAIRRLGISDGVFHLELLETPQQLVFGEIGLRPAGLGTADSLRHFFGLDQWRAFIATQVCGHPGSVVCQRDGRYHAKVAYAAGPHGTACFSEAALAEDPAVEQVVRVVSHKRDAPDWTLTHLALLSGDTSDEIRAAVARLMSLCAEPW